ncbi:MAG: hypothetical protein HWE16_02610 [Gammaproteobacteria bacterium]|nr:hypothetical protein [Gammaproteobacteria bacterium]
MKKKDISTGITGFIDILGFGSKVSNAKTFLDKKDIYDKIKNIQSAFEFDSQDELTLEVQKIHKKTVLAFSDCVVVNIPLESEATKNQGTFDPILSELSGFATAQGECCLKGNFIRGGVDRGWWFREEDTLISESLVNSYIAEGKASVPIIAISEDLIAFFELHDDRKFYSEDSDPLKSIFRSTKVGEESVWFLDYIEICLGDINWISSQEDLDKLQNESDKFRRQKIRENGRKKNIENWLYSHAREIEKAYNDASSKKVKEKYIWLSEYHNDTAVKWTKNQKCLCNI